MKNALKKLGLLITLISAMLFITGCPSPNTSKKGDDTKTYTVKIYVFENVGSIKAKDYKVEAGDTLNSIKGLTDPTLAGYNFEGYFDKNGSKFEKTTPIQSDITLFAKFIKETSRTTTGQNTVKIDSEIKTADQTTGAKTEITITYSDGSSNSTVTIVTTSDVTDKKVSEETTTVKKYEDGSSDTSTGRTIYDAEEQPVTTVQSSTSVDADGNSNSTTTTTTYAEDGTSISVTEQVSSDSAGNTAVTTSTTTTNAQGESTTTETTNTHVNANATVHQIVEQGINALTNGNVNAAQALFDKAYEKDKNDNEAKVYSALADLTKISTNSKIQKFFSDHLGITNYPSSVNALISGKWLTEGKYTYEENGSFEGIEFTEWTNPAANDLGDGWIKASWAFTDTPNAFYTTPYTYETLTIDGKTWYVSYSTKRTVEDDLEGYSEFAFGRNVRYYHNNISYNHNSYVVPDDNGTFWVCLKDVVGMPADKQPDLSGVKIFKRGTRYVSYTYPVTLLAPVFKDLKNETWFTKQVNNASYVYMLMAGNILNGNVNGLDSAIDDLYLAMFDSDEYKSAVTKIESINGSVVLPDEVVEAFELQKVFGEGEVAVGAAELKLLKTALDLYKGVFEYVQSYSFNTDLSVLKTDWTKFVSGKEPMSKDGKDYLKAKLVRYDASIDPIANGFLSKRSNEKMAASKVTFVGVLTDVIAAYDDILGEGNYPAAIQSELSKYEILKQAAVALKNAITNGGQFFIPKDLNNPLETWPTSSSSAVYTFDCGLFFTPGQFAAENLIGIGAVEGAAAAKVPLFYKVNENGTRGAQLTTSEADVQYIKDLLQEALDFKPHWDEDTDEWIELEFDLAIDLKLMASVYKVFNIPMFAPDSKAITIPVESAAILYNFYYGGLSEEITAMIDAID